jgi:hypothetical protein
MQDVSTRNDYQIPAQNTRCTQRNNTGSCEFLTLVATQAHRCKEENKEILRNISEGSSVFKVVIRCSNGRTTDFR